MKAIGLIHTGCGSDRAEDEQAIRDVVIQRGYDFAGLLTVTPHTYMPTTLIVHTAAQHNATVIVAPSIDHFGAAAHAVALACVLATPSITVPCTVGRAH
ncbi:hypothetical protein [Nocardia callitridis]|uniref:Uncharacterized protein n=1 Tax=Nocardia callitridis TaxID=648753 RepID=A0ABP9JVW5_9NOCA